MKKFLALLLVACVMSVSARSAVAEEKSASHQAAALELLTVMNTEKTLTDSIKQMLDLQIKAQPQIAQFRGVMEDFFRKHMSWDALKDDLADAYAQELTEAELKEITAFYKTPAGKKFASKLSVLTARAMEIGQAKTQAHMPELQRAIQEEVMKQQKNGQK
jgi:hypothetical protein